MKKHFCIGLLLFSLIGFSQNIKGTFEIIPVIGVASSNYHSSQKNNNDPVTTVNFGSYADYYFNDSWSVRSGLLVQTMGSEYRNGAFNTEKLNYLTVPLLVNWHFGTMRNWNLNVGFSLGFLNSAKSSGVDVKKYFNTTQYGLNYGIGYTFHIHEKFGLLVDFQGMSGLSNILKSSSTNINQPTTTNLYNSINVGGVFVL
ncbi:MAG: PorT family protein [Bacteroidetes bacterium]|nr:PorT family protein [Bacteroidota bacterium]